MKTFTLPGTDIEAPNVVLGLMRIADKSDDEIRELVAVARDCGVDFVDHADIYGGDLHVCEARFAEAINLTPSGRAEFTIQTKCGIVPGDPPHFDFSYDHIVSSVEKSLAALRTDYIDILLLHRPDALVEPDEVARAFGHLQQQGKVRSFGVSNHTPGQIELLRRSVRQPIVVNQVQLSIVHAPLIAQGVAMNMAGENQSVDRDNGLIDYCRLGGITVQAWSPFQIGNSAGTFMDSPRYAALNAQLVQLAQRYDVTPLAIATAWITRHPARMQVVLGTTRPDRVASAARGSDIALTRAEWYGLLSAAGYLVP